MRLLRISSVLVAAAAAAGCTPTCGAVCTQLIACDGLETWRMTQAECEESCTIQQDQLDQWTDVAARDAFDDELRCLSDATCAEIDAGVCYDADLWSYAR